MGLGNFLKRQAGIGRLPDSQLNENTIIKLLKGGAPFIVALPIYDTVRINAGSSISKSMGGGYSQRVYSPGVSEKHQRKINTIVNCTFEQITIRHAQSNGKHIFIKINKIARAGLHNDSVVIELIDGRRYVFTMNGDIKNQWKTLGFKPQSALNVFYNLVHGSYLTALLKQQKSEQNIHQTEVEKEAINQEKQSKQEQMIAEIEKERIKEQKIIEKQREKKIKDLIKEQEKIEKNNQKMQTQTINNFSKKIKSLKEAQDIDAISIEEYNKLKKAFIKEIKSTPIPNDIDPLNKIKDCKKLLDLNLLTQEEYDELKNKFLKAL